MEKIVYSDSWHKYFSEIGLESFDDFFNYSSGRKVNENNKRSVITFETETGPQKKQFFLKRFFNPHLKDMFFTWRNLGRLCSQGAYEWANANFLLNNGIKTYKPVCRGELTKFGIERKSFIVTEKLQGQSMESFVAENWSRLKQSQKEEIIILLGRFIRRIHNTAVIVPDLYLWHIFIQEKNPEPPEFAVIDLHRMKLNVTNKNERIKDIGRLNYSMLDKYFDEKLRLLLIESYLGKDWSGSIDLFAAKVKQQSNAVLRKRKQKLY